MLIQPDYQNRNDGFDNNTYRFYEDLDDDGYLYEIYVRIGGLKAVIIVTNGGVSVDYCRSGNSIHTNIVPERLFPDKHQLTWPNLKQIILTLEAIGIEGKTYSKADMDAMYLYWLEEEGL